MARLRNQNAPPTGRICEILLVSRLPEISLRSLRLAIYLRLNYGLFSSPINIKIRSKSYLFDIPICARSLSNYLRRNKYLNANINLRDRANNKLIENNRTLRYILIRYKWRYIIKIKTKSEVVGRVEEALFVHQKVMYSLKYNYVLFHIYESKLLSCSYFDV